LLVKLSLFFNAFLHVSTSPEKTKPGISSIRFCLICFASALTTLQAANTTGVNIRFESGVTEGEIAKVSNKLWQVGGLSSDPKVPLVVGIDITTAAGTPAAGTITMVATYILG
jgi:hypothetical protein